MSLVPVPMTQAELVEVLEDILSLVKEGDSYEGNISWQMPNMGPGIPDPPREVYAEVKAVYRMGNSMGQGGVRMVGDVVADT